MQMKISKPSDGRIKDAHLENGDSIHPSASPNENGDVKQQYEACSSGVTSHASIQKHKQNLNSGCVQTKVFLTHSDYSNSLNHTFLPQTLSGSRSEHNDYTSPHLKESSFASNIDSSHGHPLQAASLKTNDKGQNLYNISDTQPLSKSFKNESTASVVPFDSPGSAKQQLCQFENENEGHSAVRGGSIRFSQEIDSSNVQEIPSMSSAPNEISLEATSFCQLQQVMEQVLESFVILMFFLVCFVDCLLDYEVEVNIFCI